MHAVHVGACHERCPGAAHAKGHTDSRRPHPPCPPSPTGLRPHAHVHAPPERPLRGPHRIRGCTAVPAGPSRRSLHLVLAAPALPPPPHLCPHGVHMAPFPTQPNLFSIVWHAPLSSNRTRQPTCLCAALLAAQAILSPPPLNLRTPAPSTALSRHTSDVSPSPHDSLSVKLLPLFQPLLAATPVLPPTLPAVD